jgi:heme/copper-type cytochrome/quinol oxidase subunit 4
MIVFLILLTVVAIFLFMTGTLKTVSSVVIALAVLLFVGLLLIIFVENAFKDPNAVVFVGTFTLIGAAIFFFGARWLFLKYDPLLQPKKEQPEDQPDDQPKI